MAITDGSCRTPDRRASTITDALQALGDDLKSRDVDRDTLAEHVRQLTALLSPDRASSVANVERHRHAEVSPHTRRSMNSLIPRRASRSPASRSPASPAGPLSPGQYRSASADVQPRNFSRPRASPQPRSSMSATIPRASTPIDQGLASTSSLSALLQSQVEDADQFEDDLASDPAWARIQALMEDATLSGKNALASPVRSPQHKRYDSDLDSDDDDDTTATTFSSVPRTRRALTLGQELAAAGPRTPSPVASRRLASPAPLPVDSARETDAAGDDGPPAYRSATSSPGIDSCDVSAIRQGADRETAAVISAARALREHSGQETDFGWLEAFEASLLAASLGSPPRSRQGRLGSSRRVLTNAFVIGLLAILLAYLFAAGDGFLLRISGAFTSTNVSCHCTCPLPAPHGAVVS